MRSYPTSRFAALWLDLLRGSCVTSARCKAPNTPHPTNPNQDFGRMQDMDPWKGFLYTVVGFSVCETKLDVLITFYCRSSRNWEIPPSFRFCWNLRLRQSTPNLTSFRPSFSRMLSTTGSVQLLSTICCRNSRRQLLCNPKSKSSKQRPRKWHVCSFPAKWWSIPTFHYGTELAQRAMLSVAACTLTAHTAFTSWTHPYRTLPGPSHDPCKNRISI